jgi:ABC-type multidrug transport system fused ATPase/permease subunit
MNVTELISEFLKDNKGYLIGYIVFMLAYPISSVYLPKYYGQLVDDIKNDKDPNFKIVAILLLSVSAMYLILDKIDTIFIPKLQAYIRINIVKVVLENYKDKFQEQDIGMLISKIVKLPIVVRDLVRQIRNYIVPLIFIIIMVVFRFMTIHKTLGIMCISGLILMGVILFPMGSKCLNISSEMDNETDTIHEEISELFENMMDIYSMNTYDQEMEKLEKNQQVVIDRYRKTFEYTNTFRGVLNGMGIIIFLSIIIYAYQLYRRKEIILTDMVSVTITGMYVINKIGSLSGEAPDIVFNLGSYIRTQDYVNKFNLVSVNPNNPIIKESFHSDKGKVIFNNVTIQYRNKIAIKNFNLTINPSESVAIIGKIGSGKSSLVKALLRLIPYNGNIYIDDKDISNLDLSTVRSQILYVRQNPIPFNRTLYENIVYGISNVSKKDVVKLFNKYKLDSFFKHDLDESVGKRGGKLSGGQRQMIFLLRVLLSKNPIIILDEPNSSLDEISSKYVMSLLDDILDKRTVILITHDKKLGEKANRKVYLS